MVAQCFQRGKNLPAKNIVRRLPSGEGWSDTRELLYSRLLTVAWGIITLLTWSAARYRQFGFAVN